MNSALNWNDAPGGGGVAASNFLDTEAIYDLNGTTPNTLGATLTILGTFANSGSSVTVAIGTSRTLQLGNSINNAGSIIIDGLGTSSSLTLSRSGDQDIPEITGLAALNLSGGGTKTATAAIETDALLISGASTVLDMSSFQLTDLGSGISFSSDQTIKSAYTGGLPFPEGLNITSPSGYPTIELNASADQSIPGGGATYPILTLSGSGTKSISSGTVTIIGPTSTRGYLDVKEQTALVVGSGTTLDVSIATVTLYATTASDYGQLLVEGTLTNNVSNTTFVKQHYLDLSAARWIHLGTGLTGADLSTLTETGGSMVLSSTSTGSVWYWDATTSKWTSPASLSGQDPEEGFTIYAGNANGTDFLRVGSGTVAAEGSGVATSTTNVTLSYHDGTDGDPLFSGGASGYGWNLIANPYTATYDWDGQTLPSNTNNAVYVWDGINDQYTSFVSGVSANGGSRYIAPGQAFWVQTTAAPGGTLDLDPAQLTVTEEPTMFKTKLDYVHLQLKDASGQQQDEIAVRFNSAATNGFDGSFDAHKLPNGIGIPNLSADFGNQPLSVSTAPATTTSFPVSLEANGGPQNLVFTLNQTELESFTTVYLEDLHTGTTVELSNGGSYSFVHTDLDIEDRFILKFSGSTIGVDEEAIEDAVAMSILNNELVIFNHSEVLSLDATILDIQGRVISSFVSDLESQRTSVALPNLPAGVYFIRYTTNNGKGGVQRISKY